MSLNQPRTISLTVLVAEILSSKISSFTLFKSAMRSCHSSSVPYPRFRASSISFFTLNVARSVSWPLQYTNCDESCNTCMVSVPPDRLPQPNFKMPIKVVHKGCCYLWKMCTYVCFVLSWSFPLAPHTALIIKGENTAVYPTQFASGSRACDSSQEKTSRGRGFLRLCAPVFASFL